jgi:2-dehydro-3-deoxygalactonokinase
VTHLIAIDWGTSSLRAARLDAQGRTLDERSLPRGILTVPPGGFPSVFEEACGDWMKAPDSLALICGMAGSRQGWLEAPYCPCPAGFDDIVARLAWVVPGRIAMVPGLSCEADGVPDVMRGEETQVFGALRILGLQDALLVHPGTHSKWVRIANGRVEHFSTFMTGEFYALLRRHSILARTMPDGDGDLDDDAFERGLHYALRSESLLRSAFSARTLALFDRMPATALPSYLSGLVIGEELRVLRLETHSGPVIVAGADALTRRYELGLKILGIATRSAGSQAAWRGLRAIADALQGRAK